VKTDIKLGISYFDTMLNYKFFQKLKFLENCEFNHLTLILIGFKAQTDFRLVLESKYTIGDIFLSVIPCYYR